MRTGRALRQCGRRGEKRTVRRFLVLGIHHSWWCGCAGVMGVGGCRLMVLKTLQKLLATRSAQIHYFTPCGLRGARLFTIKSRHAFGRRQDSDAVRP